MPKICVITWWEVYLFPKKILSKQARCYLFWALSPLYMWETEYKEKMTFLWSPRKHMAALRTGRISRAPMYIFNQEIIIPILIRSRPIFSRPQKRFRCLTDIFQKLLRNSSDCKSFIGTALRGKKKKKVFRLFSCTVTVSNLLLDIKKSLRLCL